MEGFCLSHANDYLLPFFTNFPTLLYISTKGLKALNFRDISRWSYWSCRFLFILMAVGVPLVKPDVFNWPLNMDQLSTYIPKFDFSYFTTIALLVFSVGGAEAISPYVNKVKNPARAFQRYDSYGVMIGACAILGSLAIAMIFDISQTI